MECVEQKVYAEYQKRLFELLQPLPERQLTLVLSVLGIGQVQPTYTLSRGQWERHVGSLSSRDGYMASWEEFHGCALARAQLQREYGGYPSPAAVLRDDELGDKATTSITAHLLDPALVEVETIPADTTVGGGEVAGLFAMPYGTPGLSVAEALKQKENGETCCSYCLKTGVPLRCCAKCQRIKYCSPECQKKNWKLHKVLCPVQLPDPGKLLETVMAPLMNDRGGGGGGKPVASGKRGAKEKKTK